VLKEIHDQLLAEKPEDAQHDEATCLWCKGEFSSAVDTEIQGGSESVKTYTEDEYNSVLVKVSALETKLSELEGAQQESVVEAKIGEIKAQTEAQVAELQTKLDTAVLEAEAAKSEKDKVLEYLADVKTEADKAEETARLREERVATVKEQTSFPDSRIEERADAWASMDEAAFEAALEDWKAIAPKTNGKIPDVSTSLSASRDDQAGSDALREVLALRDRGIDARTV
jgi:hypothetical protein